MKTIQQIAASMTPQQRKDARNSIGDALEIVSGIVGDMSYSSLFNVTCAVIEEMERWPTTQHNYGRNFSS